VATASRKGRSGPGAGVRRLPGRIWGHAPRWGAKGALSGEARVDRVGEDGDVAKVAGRSRATEVFHKAGVVNEARARAGCPSCARHDPIVAADGLRRHAEGRDNAT
jgi:hypothetical protein